MKRNNTIGEFFIDTFTTDKSSSISLALDNRLTFEEFLYNMSKDNEKKDMLSKIKKVIFNNPATIVIWDNGTKTVVKCENEKFDPEKGLAMAITKKLLGNNQGYYYEVFKKWLPKNEEKDTTTVYADGKEVTEV